MENLLVFHWGPWYKYHRQHCEGSPVQCWRRIKNGCIKCSVIILEDNKVGAKSDAREKKKQELAVIVYQVTTLPHEAITNLLCIR